MLREDDTEEDIAFDSVPDDIYERRALVWWLRGHPVWKHPEHGTNCFRELVDVYLAYVNPDTGIVDFDISKNTSAEVWIEAGPFYDASEWMGGSQSKWLPSHDVRLDCGGDTLETALLNLAVRVKHFYGNGGDSNDKE